MNSKLRASLMVVVLLSVLLAACNTPAPATTMPAPTQVVATEIAPVEPTAEPTAAPVQEGLLTRNRSFDSRRRHLCSRFFDCLPAHGSCGRFVRRGRLHRAG